MYRRLWSTVFEGFTHMHVLFFVACDRLSHTHTWCANRYHSSLTHFQTFSEKNKKHEWNHFFLTNDVCGRVRCLNGCIWQMSRGRSKWVFSAMAFTHAAVLNAEWGFQCCKRCSFSCWWSFRKVKPIWSQTSGQACKARIASVTVMGEEKYIFCGCCWDWDVLTAVLF